MDVEQGQLEPEIGDIIEFAKVCRRVYPAPVNQKTLFRAKKRYESQKIIFGSLRRGFCRIFWNQDCVTVAFRGTRETYDWHTNLRFIPEALTDFTRRRTYYLLRLVSY